MPISFQTLADNYPRENFGSGPTHQCAVRMSRCLSAAAPAFYQYLVECGIAKGMLLMPVGTHRYFRAAQQLATLLSWEWGFQQSLSTGPMIAIGQGEVQALRTHLAALQIPGGIIFLKNCFNRDRVSQEQAGVPTELIPRDGPGDHIELRYCTVPNLHHIRIMASPDLFRRADEVWFWPCYS